MTAANRSIPGKMDATALALLSDPPAPPAGVLTLDPGAATAVTVRSYALAQLLSDALRVYEPQHPAHERVAALKRRLVRAGVWQG